MSTTIVTPGFIMIDRDQPQPAIQVFWPAPVTSQSAGEGAAQHLQPAGESMEEILRAGLSALARNRAWEILRDVRAYGGIVDEFALALDDGGISMEFTSNVTQRELSIVIPDDGGVRYFAARGANLFRRAGVIVAEAAVVALASWLGSRDSGFPGDGLGIGQDPVDRR